jgi:hypothetical protein
MSWCCPLFICLSFLFWSELAEYVMVLSTVFTMTYSASSDQKKNDTQINSGQHHDILSQLRPEEKWQTNKQWTTPWHTQPAPTRRKMTNK